MKDAFNNKLRVGDSVIFTYSSDANVHQGFVEGFTKKKVRIASRYVEALDPDYDKEFLAVMYPRSVAKRET